MGPAGGVPPPPREEVEEGAGGGCSPLRWGVSGRGGAGRRWRPRSGSEAAGGRESRGSGLGRLGWRGERLRSLTAGRLSEGGGWASRWPGEEVSVTLFRFSRSPLFLCWQRLPREGRGQRALPRVVGNAAAGTGTSALRRRDGRRQVREAKSPPGSFGPAVSCPGSQQQFPAPLVSPFSQQLSRLNLTRMCGRPCGEMDHLFLSAS